MTVTNQDIEDIVNLIWESVLEMQIAPAPDVIERIVGASGDQVGAQVRITGAFEGTVALHCSADLAHSLTAAMFMLNDEEVDGEQLRDAIGELANMIGGNIKALLPQPSQLGLPEEVAVVQAGPNGAAQIELECNGQPLLVTFIGSD